MFLAGTQQLGVMAGARHLLAEVTVSLTDGDRVGILGPNGAGKSTLLKLLAGLQEPDQGTITVTRGVSFASLSQSDDFPAGITIKQAVHGNKADFQWASQPLLRQIDQGLLGDLDLNTPVASLSGGQRRRVALAATLGKDAPILALDEPTNHLDLEAVDWLASYLNQRFAKPGGALVVITHDRWFLDAVCNSIWEVVPGVDPGRGRAQIPGRVEIYQGGYGAYILARTERAAQAAQAEAKRQNLLRKELAWLQRGAPARTSKPRFRVEAAQALIANTPPPRDQVELVKMASARLGKRVIELEQVSFSYPDNPRLILNQVTWRLAPGERVGVIGINGAGKSTLLKILTGKLAPLSGRVKTGKTVVAATLDQHPEVLVGREDDRVVEAVSRIKERIQVGDKEITAAQLVERLGFTKERAWTALRELSGGEKRRLQLVCQLLAEPNVLLLDEPTNDLDTDTLAQLEDLLDSFCGTMVVVSHDRYLLQRVTDHQVALLPDGTLRFLPGGVEQYLDLRASGQLNWENNQTAGLNANSPLLDSKAVSAAMTGSESTPGTRPSTTAPGKVHAGRPHSTGEPSSLPAQSALDPGFTQADEGALYPTGGSLNKPPTQPQTAGVSLSSPSGKNTGESKAQRLARYQALKKLGSLEKKMAKAEEKVAELDRQLAEVATKGESDMVAQLTSLNAQRQLAVAAQEQLEEAWLELAEDV